MKILISSFFFPFSFSVKKGNQQLIYTFFTNTKECGRSGAESIWIFHSLCNYTTALKFILITIFIFYAPNQTCHVAQVWPHHLKQSHMQKTHFHRRHLVTAICIVAGIQLTSMAPFIDMCIHVYIPRIMAVWVGTAIVPCCLFDMQRSAVEQLHGPR